MEIVYARNTQGAFGIEVSGGRLYHVGPTAPTFWRLEPALFRVRLGFRYNYCVEQFVSNDDKN